MPVWPQRKARRHGRKYLIARAAYTSVPPKGTGDGRETSNHGLEAADKPFRVQEAYGNRSAGRGIDLIPNLIPNSEEHGKHGKHGKIVVNERILLR